MSQIILAQIKLQLCHKCVEVILKRIYSVVSKHHDTKIWRKVGGDPCIIEDPRPPCVMGVIVEFIEEEKCMKNFD